jgi:hypothetical protein
MSAGYVWLNKIKYLRAKTGKWAWAGYSKLAKITYAWGTKTLKNCKFQSWIYIISHFIAETLTTRWLFLYSYIASGHWSNDKLIHIDLCIYVSYLMKRSLRTQTHLAIGSQINRLSFDYNRTWWSLFQKRIVRTLIIYRRKCWL